MAISSSNAADERRKTLRLRPSGRIRDIVRDYSPGDVDKRDSETAWNMIQRSSLGRAVLIRCLISDDEWSFFTPFLTEKRSGGGRPPVRDGQLEFSVPPVSTRDGG